MINFLCFLVPFLDPLRIQFLGEFCVGEFLIPLIGLITFRRSLYIIKRNHVVKIFFSFILIYFIFQIGSDLYRHSSSDDAFRGWARIAITLVSFFSFLGAFWENPRAIGFFCFGCASSFLPSIFVTDQSFDLNTESWKWLYSLPLSAGVFLGSGFLLKKRFLSFDTRGIVYVVIGILVSASFLLNFRSLAGLTAISGFILYSQFSRENYQVRSFKQIFLMPLILCIFGFGLLYFYKWGASSGFLGEAALAKYEMQSNEAGDFNLSSGRTELFFSWEKICESPIIGWGSWAKDREYVLGRYRELQGDKQVFFPEGQEGLIPAHSHIFGGWLEAGLGGALFWILFFLIVARNIPFITFHKFDYLMPILIYLSVIELWDLVFSPWGAGRRDYSGAFLAIQCYMAYLIGFSRMFQLIPSKQFTTSR